MIDYGKFVGGGGINNEWRDLGTLTGVVALDLSEAAGFKVTQGSGELEIDVVNNPELRADAVLEFIRNPVEAVSFGSGIQEALNPNVWGGVAPYIGAGEISLSGGGINTARGGTFSENGLRLWVGSTAFIREYLLNNSFDPSQGVTAGATFNVSAETSVASRIVFQDDGLKMLLTASNSTTSNAYEYTLGSPFDITTLSYTGNNFTVPNATDFWITPDGSRLFRAGVTNDPVIEAYDIATPFDLSTVTGVVDTLDLSPFVTTLINNRCLFVSRDGRTLFYTNTTAGQPSLQFVLTTPLSLSSAVLIDSSLSAGLGYLNQVFWDDNEFIWCVPSTATNQPLEKRTMVGASLNEINQYGPTVGLQGLDSPYETIL